MIAIVDTSVVLKWYAAEPDSADAERLLAHALGAPDFLLIELANALGRKVRQREMAAAQAEVALPHARAAVELLPAAPYAERALALSLSLEHSVYDCLFLALAEDLDLPLVTADRRFHAKLATGMERLVLLEDWGSD